MIMGFQKFGTGEVIGRDGGQSEEPEYDVQDNGLDGVTRDTETGEVVPGLSHPGAADDEREE